MTETAGIVHHLMIWNENKSFISSRPHIVDPIAILARKYSLLEGATAMPLMVVYPKIIIKCLSYKK